MADFINTIDSLEDDAVFDSIIKRTITEFNDDKITNVRGYAFNGCANLTAVSFPAATIIGGAAFGSCSSLVSFNADAATSIMNSVFNSCTKLSELNIPSVTEIGNYAFSSCKALREVSTPLLTTLGTFAFENCQALTEINFPKVKVVNTGAFKGCIVLKTADFASATSIGANAFYNCYALKALILRNTASVVSLANTNALGDNGVSRGTGYIYVPSALIEQYRTASGWSTFANQFRKLEEWTVDGTVTGELNIEGRHMVRFFDEDGTLLSYVIVPTGSDAVYSGDEPVKEGEYAFAGWNPAPTNITADTDCYAQFKSTAIYSQKIIERTISEYSSETLTYVGKYAFNRCFSLTSIDFPVVTTIDVGAFAFCTNLTTLILRSETMCNLKNTDAFTSTPIASGTGYIYVPSALIDSYKSSSGWSVLASKIRAIEDYPEICGGER
jgi:hypothetical protein